MELNCEDEVLSSRGRTDEPIPKNKWANNVVLWIGACPKRERLSREIKPRKRETTINVPIKIMRDRAVPNLSSTAAAVRRHGIWTVEVGPVAHSLRVTEIILNISAASCCASVPVRGSSPHESKGVKILQVRNSLISTR